MRQEKNLPCVGGRTGAYQLTIEANLSEGRCWAVTIPLFEAAPSTPTVPTYFYGSHLGLKMNPGKRSDFWHFNAKKHHGLLRKIKNKYFFSVIKLLNASNSLDVIRAITLLQ